MVTTITILLLRVTVNNFFANLFTNLLFLITFYDTLHLKGDTTMEELYKNIKKRRLELGMTQSELARLAGYENRSSIARIERGDHDLPQSKIEEIAKALKVTPSYLMGWEDEEVAELTAMQEETIAKFLMLTHEHQLVVESIVDTLTSQENG